MNYYDILEVKAEASAADIKKSYRKLAMKYHPDRNSGNKAAEDAFKLINEAYITLSDSTKREDYDYSLMTENGANPYNFNTHSFEEMFKDLAIKSGFNLSNVHSIDVSLTFLEAALGCEKTYDILITTTSGKKKVKFSVKFAEATDDGDLLPVSIDGHNLILSVKVLDDLSFERDDLDIFCMLDVPFTTAALGGSVIYHHWSKNLEINVPEGIENGTKIRLANMGLKRGIFTGDLHLVVKIVTPKKLNRKQRELLNEFEDIETEKNVGLYTKLKSMWNSLFGHKSQNI